MSTFEAAKQSFMQGLQFLEANNLEAAETQFGRSLELLPERVSTLNNLSAVKIQLDKLAEAEEFARKAIAIDGQSAEAWANLGIALTKMACHEEALQAYDRALGCNPGYARAWLNKAVALLELKRYDEALQACEEALKRDPNQHELLHKKSLILKELGKLAEARKAYLTSLAMRIVKSPVFIAERRATQKADALIVNPDPRIDESQKSFETLHLESPNFPLQLAHRLARDFHFSFVFHCDAASDSARRQIPQPDIVINNCVNAEAILSEGSLPRLIDLVDGFHVPVVNHPSKAVQSGRDKMAKLLENIPGVVVPKTMRFFPQGRTPEQLADEIEAQFDYPLIVRSLTAQRGMGMEKADSREELIKALSAEKLGKGFFVTQFMDARRGDELFRKIRASIVGDEIIVVRVDFDPGWKVHGGRSGRRISFYLENPRLLEVEKQVCADPEKELGRPAMQSLGAIRDRIPLDIFGMDFNVDADGQVVFYEANATMNLLSTAQAEVANPKEADDRLKQAFRRYLGSLANCLPS